MVELDKTAGARDASRLLTETEHVRDKHRELLELLKFLYSLVSNNPYYPAIKISILSLNNFLSRYGS